MCDGQSDGQTVGPMSNGQNDYTMLLNRRRGGSETYSTTPPLLQPTQIDAEGHSGVRFVAYGTHSTSSRQFFLFIQKIRGHPKKGVLQTKAPRELGLFALCSEAQNMIPHNANKINFFLAYFAMIFLAKKIRYNLENI